MIVAGTGHRPNKLGGYDLVTFNKLVKLAEKNLQKLNATYVISGMALGWDMALAKAAINLNIPFAAYIPFKDQPILWPHSSQLLYFQLLEKTDKIVNTSNSYSYTAIKMQKRNEKMVDDCDILLAIWDGSFGGTANCLKYAATKNVKVINIYSEYK